MYFESIKKVFKEVEIEASEMQSSIDGIEAIAITRWGNDANSDVPNIRQRGESICRSIMTLEDKEEEEFKYEERDEIMEENSPSPKKFMPIERKTSNNEDESNDNNILNEPVDKEWKPVPKSEAVIERYQMLAPMEEEEPKITPADLPSGAQNSLYSMLQGDFVSPLSSMATPSDHKITPGKH